MKNSRGFTLLEAMVVVGIMGVLAAMTAVGLNSLTRRAEASTLLGELAQEINNAKMLAAQYGDPIVIGFYDDTDKSKQSQTGFYTFREREGLIDLENPTWPPTQLGTTPKISRLNFRWTSRSVLAPKMPDNITTFSSVFPFNAVFMTISPSDPVCSFCTRSSTAHIGYMRIFPDGRIAFWSKSVGGGVLVVRPDPNQPNVSALAILAPSAMTRIF